MSDTSVNESIRVLVGEHHPSARAGLRQLFTSAAGFELVGLASRGEEVVALAASRAPAVVVLELTLPGLDAIAATARVVQMLPDARVVILTCLSNRWRLAQAHAAGASAHVLKDAEPQALLDVVAEVAEAAVSHRLPPPSAARAPAW